jgi:hypothetical protein
VGSNWRGSHRLELRDGLHCRFCGIPLIRREVRERIRMSYPTIWGRQNFEQHAALQAMWLQYDHVLPHSLGGDNRFENLIITCAPCNYARMDFTLDQLGLRACAILATPNPCAQVGTAWSGFGTWIPADNPRFPGLCNARVPYPRRSPYPQMMVPMTARVSERLFTKATRIAYLR